ncbi:DNA-directed DNA polymerase [Asticcacaulis sp. BYS171W]|uniref:DNA-directed DNA polymerase n=1 Tax=Asticcacaulis aquaticus TaxID=2984212 RepID=A0ABT5HV84_9CAUL|nr:DNA-directed DNA polymerase [Asticcacaulis aquaticus]MDC7684001.1 DNA-directed DNA polymerase [Asticcacaulis aquaticus]
MQKAGTGQAGDDGGGLKWLYLDMNAFFASCEQQMRPELRRRPLIVVPVRSDYTCAIAASAEAKALGIKTGTQVKLAKQMCPGLAIVDARPDLYVDIHHRILDVVDTVMPVEKVCSIDEVACLLMGPQRHEAAARALGHRIQKRILERIGECLTASIGIAPSRMLAKTAADMMKPLGMTVLRMDHLPGPLLGLEVDDFPGIGAAMKGRLFKAGISEVRQLWHLSPSRMRQLWGGIGGDNFWYALHGVDPPETVTERHSISHSHVLASELRPVEAARPVARRLTVKCGTRLRRMGLRCGGLHLSIRGTASGRAQAERVFPATSDTFRLLEAIDDMWHQCVGALNQPRIQKVSVTCLRMIPADTPPDLFGYSPAVQEDGRHMKLLKALDGLNERFGKDRVSIGPRPKLHDFVGAKIAFNRVPEVEEFWE